LTESEGEEGETIGEHCIARMFPGLSWSSNFQRVRRISKSKKKRMKKFLTICPACKSTFLIVTSKVEGEAEEFVEPNSNLTPSIMILFFLVKKFLPRVFFSISFPLKEKKEND